MILHNTVKAGPKFKDKGFSKVTALRKTSCLILPISNGEISRSWQTDCF